MTTSAATAPTARTTWRRRSRKRGGGGLARPVTTVKVVELVAEDFAGVIKALPLEGLACPGVGVIELLARGIQLVSQVIGPALLNGRIGQLPSDCCRVGLPGGIQPDVAHLDDGERLLPRCVCQ